MGRVFGDERLQVSSNLYVLPELQRELTAFDQRRQPQLNQSSGLHARPRLRREIRERFASPRVQSLVVARQSDDRIVAIDQSAGLDVIAKAVEGAFGERAKMAVLEDNATRREEKRSSGQAVFIAGGSAAIATPSRAHTNFGS